MINTQQTIEKAATRKLGDSAKISRVNIPLNRYLAMKLQALSKWEKIALIHIGAQIIEDFVNNYEEENGTVFSKIDFIGTPLKDGYCDEEATKKRTNELIAKGLHYEQMELVNNG